MSFRGEPGRCFMTTWEGRIALVTSAESARPLAIGLAHLGATVVVAMSEESAATALAEGIADETRNPRVHGVAIDLRCRSSVSAAAQNFIARYHWLHVLVSDTTVPLGPTLLANLLLDTMKRSGNGRIVRLAIPSARRQIWSAALSSARAQ